MGARAGGARAVPAPLSEAFFCEGLDITAESELRRAARAARLSPDEAVGAAHSPELIARIGEIRREARAAGVRGVPTFVDGDGVKWGLGATAAVHAGPVS